MRLMLNIAACAAVLLFAGACSKSGQNNVVTTTVAAPALKVGGDQATLPRAVVYRMSGDYAANVPITLDASGTKIVSYPAPGDLGAAAAPVDLGNGYWLDRRGVSKNSVFTRYTYSDYRKLQHAPSVDELLKAVIPGARVTELVRLPISASEAAADPALCKPYIENNFVGCAIE